MPEPILRVEKLSAGYGARHVLSSVSLNIALGEWFSLLGPNAVGKTTLLYCVSDQLPPSEGAVWLGGHNLASEPQLAKQHLGYAHAPDQLPALLTGRQCLEVYAAARRIGALDSELTALAGELKLAPLLDQYVETYSLGTRQKLSILLALVGAPSLIVLDEAFNGVDPTSSLILKRFLAARVQAKRCSVLLATHALDIVLQYSTRAALLIDGQIANAWTADQLAAFKASGIESLEIALTSAASAEPVPSA